ncbi:hypothetical protein LTR64_000032 [Lithohypha guttulata]|uniref:uncharacterized protein n=1 Tax=Lithohypha guttulata TaxID=1690604 RepID=UPI002DDF4D61|nr:hypothetical protein LTR51_007394 [Lithohypha guttulata]
MNAQMTSARTDRLRNDHDIDLNTAAFEGIGKLSEHRNALGLSNAASASSKMHEGILPEAGVEDLAQQSALDMIGQLVVQYTNISSNELVAYMALGETLSNTV